MSAPAVGLDTNLVEKVGIHISAKNLPKLHTFNMTDPFAAIFVLDKKRNALVGSGVTETIKDSLNPKFTKLFNLDYLFEEAQEVIIQIYHNTGHQNLLDFERHELIGEFRFPLANLMCAPGQVITAALRNANKVGANLGEIEVRAEPIANTRDLFMVQFSASKLVNKEGFFSKSDPFLEISRMNEDGSYTSVWRSEHKDNTLNPAWTVAKIPMVGLCNGDIDRPLKIEIFDHERSGKHVFMGMVTTSVRGMLTSNNRPMPVIEPEKQQKKKGYVDSGTLTAGNAQIEYHPAFSDFIMGGLEISLSIGIDFTGSNGDPREPTSLHYLDPAQKTWNVYQQAIHSVATVLEPYDADKKYAVFGFGARVRAPDGTFTPAQHCFPVYGGGNEVTGIPGVMQAYSDCLHHVMLSGPTLLAPIINATCHNASMLGCTQERQKYHILLIITDGVVNDMDATKQAIIAASHQAVSIIIIGVGPADFKDMAVLDGDKERLTFAGQSAARDIVQFVAFTPGMAAGQLAEQVLAEIPRQALEYFEKNRILPNGRR
jgi:hypothetical protein